MDALTSAGRLFGSTLHEHRLGPSGSLCFNVWPSEHSVPNHLTTPAVAFAHNPSARQAFWASPLNRRLAGRPGRNGFTLLRTARSPPVALHSLSRGRSCFQFQAGVCLPEEDLHLSDQTSSQTHDSRAGGNDGYIEWRFMANRRRRLVMGVGPNGRMIVWSSQNRRAPPPEENAKRGWRIDGAGALQVEDGNDWNGKSPSGFHSHHLGRDPVL